jgi:hypothetical protein
VGQVRHGDQGYGERVAAAMSEPKRRLPVLRSTPSEEEGEPPRPVWQWIGFGVAAIFGAWVPLQYAGEAIAQRVSRAFVGEPQSYDELQLALAALSQADHAKLTVALFAARVVPIVLATLAGGYLMGRWGTDKVTARHAAIAGAASAAAVTAMLLVMPAPMALTTPLVLFVIMVPVAWLGGRAGLTARVRSMTPNVK